MIVVQGTLVSEELFSNHFVCDLNACKGTCCVDGASGAPLTEEECATLMEIYPDIKDGLSVAGKKEIEDNAPFYIDLEKKIGRTSLLEDGTCVFAVQENGITHCGIEKAWKAGKTKFRKPISCHLYPVRVLERGILTALNYDVWEICKDACSLGEELKVPVFRFVKDAIIREYGEEFFKELEIAYDDYLLETKENQ